MKKTYSYFVFNFCTNDSLYLLNRDIYRDMEDHLLDYLLLQSGGQSGVWTVSVIILSIGTWVGRVGPRPADGELALLTSPRERLETVRQVLSEVPLIDGHNDLPWNIRNFLHNQLAEFDFNKDLRQVAPWSKSAWSQTDLVRLRQGMVGGQVIARHICVLKENFVK